MYRWYYNRAIQWCEENKIYGFRTVRNSLRNSVDRKFEVPEWSTIKTPPRILSGAISDCCNAYKSSFSLLKNKRIDRFEMRYKTKKSITQTLYLEKSCFGKNNTLFKTFGIGQLKCFRRRSFDVKIPELTIDHDCRLSYNSVLRKWFLLVPTDFITSYDRQVGGDISLDPGIRTFLTGYSPDGLLFECGNGSYERVWKLHLIKDKIVSRLSKANSKRRKKSLRRAILAIGERIRNLTNELHYKTIRWLLRFKRVIVGDMSSSSIIRNCNTYDKTKRLMAAFRFYEFKKRLLEKGEETNTLVYYVNEAWTSKTCCKCNSIKHDLGSAKLYRCEECNINIDRDVNGAINIYKKFLNTQA